MLIEFLPKIVLFKEKIIPYGTLHKLCHCKDGANQGFINQGLPVITNDELWLLIRAKFY